jgi:hypothetical protein
MSLAQQNRFLNPFSGWTFGMTKRKLSFRYPSTEGREIFPAIVVKISPRCARRNDRMEYARRDDMSFLIVISNAVHPRSGPFGKGTSEKSFKEKQNKTCHFESVG